MLHNPDADKYKCSYSPIIDLSDMHFVYKYSGISIDKLMELDIYEYRVLLINAVVDQALQTDKGRELLNRYASLEAHHTEFDVEGLSSIL